MFPGFNFSDALPAGSAEAMLSSLDRGVRGEEHWYTRAAARKYYVYLCGPIIGLSFDECAEYYRNVAAMLPPWVVPVSPMRGKGSLQGHGTIWNAYPQHGPLGTEQGIVSRDFFDVRRVDVILANFLNARRVSIGSVFELAWAFQLQKPVVLAMEETGNPHDHAFVRQACAFRTAELEQACQTVVQIVTPGL
jgi:nucleoside 2-deoxyribosyltransferase